MKRKLEPGDRMLTPANGRPAPGYQYRGSQLDANTPFPDDRCGTYAGWNAHKYLDEPPCKACQRAANRYVQGWRKRGKCKRGLGWPL